ncbi:hypothetical protein BKA83DRAFT_303040 [Pisolithus microcarpus]|nr:hypothetical protein BKA83DRAFT_303040 [Pisolithus microcarpus]
MLTSKVTRTYIRRNPHDVNTTPSQGKPLGQSNQIKRHTKSSAWPFYCPPLPPLSQAHRSASLSPKRHPSLSPHFDLPDQNQAGHMVSVPWTLRTFSGTLQSVYEECDRVGLASRVTQPADYVVPWALWLSFRVFGLYRNLWTCVRKTHSTSCPSHPCGMMPHHVRGRRTFGEIALITTNLTPEYVDFLKDDFPNQSRYESRPHSSHHTPELGV